MIILKAVERAFEIHKKNNDRVASVVAFSPESHRALMNSVSGKSTYPNPNGNGDCFMGMVIEIDPLIKNIELRN